MNRKRAVREAAAEILDKSGPAGLYGKRANAARGRAVARALAAGATQNDIRAEVTRRAGL
ncbi:hypothetical protein [Streptomyces paludis]|uniref:Uncharacterized protein n=1 Tax=Streptomyces paludis TaxID=2282738 RepID=A0A345HSJ4_9ACTN|nr:hypothetical protein [Streptomyces paludis]AXG79668.1 hypothetical protein DVK44_20700 [Streptomyces paludis]